MNWRLAVASTLLLGLCAACPRTWGRGGTMDRAMAKDIRENLQRNKPACLLTEAEWADRCEDPDDWEFFDCPKECR
jgi:hypothetical protein